MVTEDDFKTLCNLLKKRDEVNEGWIADWDNQYQEKWIIQFLGTVPRTYFTYSLRRPLVFKDEETAEAFISQEFFSMIKIMDIL